MSATPPSFRIDRPEVLADPYKLFATMRAEAPVCRLEPAQFWAVSRYDDVVFVLKNHALFSNHAYRRIAEQAERAGAKPQPPSIIAQDPPRHTQLRNLVLRAFTPRVIASLEPRIREISRELLAAMAKKESFDLVSDFTVPLPMIVIAELLGVAPERREQFKTWCDEMMTTVSLIDDADPTRAARASLEVQAYFEEIIERRKAEPKDDLISLLVAAEIEGEKLTVPEVVSFANLLLIAGNETTTSLVGNALVALTDHPDQYDKLLANPALVPNAVEEVLRWQSPAQLIMRVATQDVTLSGTTIPAGSAVAPILASANRDDARFPNGERFDIERDTKGHIAFGLDIHFCLGASLARLEGKVALEELLALGKLRRVEQTVRWAPSLLLRSPMRLDLSRA